VRVVNIAIRTKEGSFLMITTKDIRDHFLKVYPSEGRPNRSFIYFDELRLGTGWSNEQRVDGFLLELWPSRDFCKTAFEFKVSRQDFLKEIKNPQKRYSAKSYSDRFVLVTANDICTREEIPEDCGWYIFNGTELEIKVHAPKLPPVPNPEWAFVCSLLRNFEKGVDVKNTGPIENNPEVI